MEQTNGPEGQSFRAKGEDEVVDEAVDHSEELAAIDADIESVLNEIDGVLEENAEEFVRGYVQKGGE